MVHCQRPGMMALELFGRDSRIGQGQPLLATGQGIPSRSYKVIHGWSLAFLGLVECGRCHAVNRGHMTPILSLRQLSKRPRVPVDLRVTSSCTIRLSS